VIQSDINCIAKNIEGGREKYESTVKALLSSCTEKLYSGNKDSIVKYYNAIPWISFVLSNFEIQKAFTVASYDDIPDKILF